MDYDLIQHLQRPAQTRIVLLVIEGLGGLPRGLGNLTELETARTPYLDDLARHSICGLHQAVHPAVTPGSSAACLSLLGYDLIEWQVGRGVLTALDIGFDLKGGDIAACGTFEATMANGQVDRRQTGSLITPINQHLCKLLGGTDIDGASLFVEPIIDDQFLLVIRGEDIHPEIGIGDMSGSGLPPVSYHALIPRAQTTADIVNRFVAAAGNMLEGQAPSQTISLQDFSPLPQWPSMTSMFGMQPAIISADTICRRIGTLVGMEVLESRTALPDQLGTLEKRWRDAEFFYVHTKTIDSAEDGGDFDHKVSRIEQIDERLPKLLALKPDVLIVTGNHSTPSLLNRHSWHPVPVILNATHCRPDSVDSFGERACLAGGLGQRFAATDLIPLAMANAGRLEPFGA
jgi:2,3-bisphosphoglycerate-independent phosphoglycerate mutase